MGESGRYLYAVTRDLADGALDGVPGLSGGRLELVDHDGLVAVVSDVDLAEYGDEGLRQNLERLDWLETAARTHDAVIKAVADVAPVAPMRLATIFLDDHSLRRRLTEWHHALGQVLDRVEGRHEWSVKVLLPAPRTEEQAVEHPASGADYLLRKKATAERHAAREAETQKGAQDVHDALAARSIASRVLPQQDPRLSGLTGSMLLNAAYLVARDDGAAFARAAEACAREHEQLEVDVRGPWPPYSFAMLEQR